MKKPEKPPFIPKAYHYGDVLDELIRKGRFSDFVSTCAS